jgi:hypothetical protein
MEFRTIVEIPKPQKQIDPSEELLFVGSCFADNIGKKFLERKFRAIVNPFGVMYNPASILHTIERLTTQEPSAHNDSSTVKSQYSPTTLLTLGTNHVYILNSTGEIVDNCQKRPQKLFTERELSVDECVEYLSKAVELLNGNVIITVSPIRYAKYGYHESQLSKATLLLAAHALQEKYPNRVFYFPAYEIVNDELRDYRFYASDMLHPSEQAVDYIYERFAETFFSKATWQFVKAYEPIRKALEHRPFNATSPEYIAFKERTQQQLEEIKAKYPLNFT